MVMLKACCADCAGLLESVTCTVKLETELAVGVPEMTPVAALRLKPAGNVPLKRLHVNGPRPPLTAKVWLYTDPMLPFGNVVVVIVGAGGKLMVMLRACVADCGGLLESVTLIVKFTGPFGPVGVPVIAPVPAFKVKPAGNAPTLREKVSGAWPPVVAIVWLYAVPSTPFGNDVVDITGASGRLMVMLNA